MPPIKPEVDIRYTIRVCESRLTGLTVFPLSNSRYVTDAIQHLGCQSNTFSMCIIKSWMLRAFSANCRSSPREVSHANVGGG